MIPRAVRDAVYERAGNACERCGRTDALTYSVHHRRPRGMGGSRDPLTDHPANLLLLCGSGTTGCHGLIERSREDAYRLGYLVRQGQDPRQVPVVRACSPYRDGCTDDSPCVSCPWREAS